MVRSWKAWSPRRRRIVTVVIGAVVGGLIGFAYYRMVGCSTGACPITSNPWVATSYGAVIGALLGGA